jgi:hypothetical protein
MNKNLNSLKKYVLVLFLTVFIFSLARGIVNAQSITINFGINNIKPWIQTKDSDIRIESGDSIIGGGSEIGTSFDDPLPGSASDSPAQYCGTDPSYSNAFASLQGVGGTPGIVFSGTNDYSFGAGLASIYTTTPPFGWVVGGSYANDYNSQLSRKTSYDFILSKATQGGLTPVDLRTACLDLQNCDLSDAIANPVTPFSHGLYKAEVPGTSLILTGGEINFPVNQNFVILVNGDLVISTKIKVPVGSTAVFIVKGNITVSTTVGEGDFTSTVPDLEGMYSADNNFIIDGNNNCASGPDLRLNLAGNIVTGAGGEGGAFINRRDLCDGNASCPVFFVAGRPDFILNLPTLIRYTNFTWQEVAP